MVEYGVNNLIYSAVAQRQSSRLSKAALGSNAKVKIG